MTTRLGTRFAVMGMLGALGAACGGSEPDAFDRLVVEVQRAAEIDCRCVDEQRGVSSETECVAETTITEEQSACIRRGYAAAGINLEPTAQCMAEQYAKYSECRLASDLCQDDCEYLVVDEAYWVCLKTSVTVEDGILKGCQADEGEESDAR